MVQTDIGITEDANVHANTDAAHGGRRLHHTHHIHKVHKAACVSDDRFMPYHNQIQLLNIAIKYKIMNKKTFN